MASGSRERNLEAFAWLVVRQVVSEASCVVGRRECPSIKKMDRVVSGMPAFPPDPGIPSRSWDSAQAWSDGAQGEEKDREAKSFPLLSHTATEG